MVYGAINYKGEKYYTFLKKVFDAIDNVQKDYNWLITNCECYPYNHNFKELLNKEYIWISGEELTQIVNKEDFQWVWAVLSGFEKSTQLSEVLKHQLPYADGNKELWVNPLTLQHPLAKLEIVCFDSTSTLILSKEKQIIDSFRTAFTDSENLENYNNL